MMSEIFGSRTETKTRLTIASPLIGEDLDQNSAKELVTPKAGSKFHYILEAKKSKGLWLEKHVQGNMDYQRPNTHGTEDFSNEFFESSLLRLACEAGILNKEKIVVPRIVLEREVSTVYYSEFISGTVSLASHSSEQKKALGQLRKPELAAPLTLLHLVCGDKNRGLENYGFIKMQRATGDDDYKIVIFDMSGGRGTQGNKHGLIGKNLLSDLNKDEITQYWPEIERFIEENALVNKIIDTIPAADELKQKKKERVLENIKNIDSLLETELRAHKKAA